MRGRGVLVGILVAPLLGGAYATSGVRTQSESALSSQVTPLDTGIDSTVRRYLDATRTRDTAALGRLLHSTMRLVTSLRRGDDLRVLTLSRDQYLETVARATGPEWNQRLVTPNIKQDGGLAALWSPYLFHRGAAFDHCGVIAMHLVRQGGHWTIAQISDTHRTEACPQAP